MSTFESQGATDAAPEPVKPNTVGREQQHVLERYEQILATDQVREEWDFLNEQRRIVDSAFEGVHTAEDFRRVHAVQLERLLGMEDKFSTVLRTDRNSHYFYTQSGFMLRIKDAEACMFGEGRNLGFLSVTQPITSQSFWVPAEEFERIQELREIGADNERHPFVDQTFTVLSAPEPGAIPIEFDSPNIDDRETLIERSGNTIAIQGMRYSSMDYPIQKKIGPFHTGHPIVDVIKNAA